MTTTICVKIPVDRLNSAVRAYFVAVVLFFQLQKKQHEFMWKPFLNKTW